MSKPQTAQTSHAHSLEPLSEGKLADASKTLSDQFAKAKSLQLEKLAAAKEQPSNMSFARTLEIDGKETKLDRASQTMKTNFDRTREPQQQPANDRGPIPPVKEPKPAPQMHLKPGGDLQKEVDRPIHHQELGALARRAKEVNDAAKAQNAHQNQHEMNNDRSRDMDRSR